MKQSRSGYINHCLNHSPSKNVRSFGRPSSSPFRQQQPRHKMRHDDETRHESRKTVSPGKGSPGKEWREVSELRKLANQGSPSRYRDFEKYSPSRKTLKSPGKRTRTLNEPDSGEYRQLSPSRDNAWTHRLAANGQFYPVGIQINKDGKYVLSSYKNVKSPSFGTLNQNRHQREPQVGPGSYNVANNSPGKYVESKNKTYAGYSFGKSPRKGPEDTTHDTNFGPGMYNTFSEFGFNQ